MNNFNRKDIVPYPIERIIWTYNPSNAISLLELDILYYIPVAVRSILFYTKYCIPNTGIYIARHSTMKKYPSVLIYILTIFGYMNVVSFTSGYWCKSEKIINNLKCTGDVGSVSITLKVRNMDKFESGNLFIDDIYWPGLKAITNGNTVELLSAIFTYKMILDWSMVEPLCNHDAALYILPKE